MFVRLFSGKPDRLAGDHRLTCKGGHLEITRERPGRPARPPPSDLNNHAPGRLSSDSYFSPKTVFYTCVVRRASACGRPRSIKADESAMSAINWLLRGGRPQGFAHTG